MLSEIYKEIKNRTQLWYSDFRQVIQSSKCIAIVQNSTILTRTNANTHGKFLNMNILLHLILHDRSCLDMSEADGVDGGAICKRGFIHLQFAEKLEAPEAERHLGSRILE
ncbi:hypothetical protein V1477_007138 [Vespula maculifrons]|uniref:Uncharacterized protein n=1 Tax=Vespula maculifrons TaxID=7453 RepID=A0ABD2CHN6_VESMC